jgi:spore coat polysaccharide biosynthesis predicted glycosyltransferase SpsG
MKKKSSILIRTSGGRAPSKELGLGHVYRMINLAKRIKFHHIYFLLEDYGGAKSILKNNGFENIFLLKPDINVKDDIKKSKKLIEDLRCRILVVDKFGINNYYLDSLENFVKIIVISDLNYIDFKADLVVNGFIGFKNSEIRNRYQRRCLIGPKFQILDKQYEEKNKIRKKYDLIASFGGYDEKHICDMLLKSLEQYIPKIKAKIVLGNATKKTPIIRKFERKYAKYVSIVRTSENFHKDICQSKYGLCSGGITSYEYASIGIPFGIICQVKHQLKTAKIWEKSHTAQNLGLVGYHTYNKIENFLKNVLESKISYSYKRSNLVDGLGGKRITTEILKNLGQVET